MRTASPSPTFQINASTTAALIDLQPGGAYAGVRLTFDSFVAEITVFGLTRMEPAVELACTWQLAMIAEWSKALYEWYVPFQRLAEAEWMAAEHARLAQRERELWR